MHLRNDKDGIKRMRITNGDHRTKMMIIGWS